MVAIGETMGLVVNDRPGPLSSSRAHTASFGGAESNVAIALSRLGVSTAWISRLGNDPFGELILRELAAEGVATVTVTDTQRPTGFMHKHRRTTLAATVTFWRAGSAASALSPSDVPDELIVDADLLHLTGILPGLSDTACEAALHAAHVARASGTAISFDINHRSKVWTGRNPRAIYLELIRLADVVFAGEDEAALVVEGSTPAELANALHNLGPNECIIKLGAAGAISRVGSDTLAQPAFPVDAIDTVGAGDAFVAGYLSARLDEASPADRLARGALAGALACLTTGDWEGAPTRAELASLTASEGTCR
ncbi:MAG: sugar kinase [Microbacterium chocolatum]|nr:sugar kinase [Microbacterium chocolatum]